MTVFLCIILVQIFGDDPRVSTDDYNSDDDVSARGVNNMVSVLSYTLKCMHHVFETYCYIGCHNS
jgi:hypothetical protein